MSSFLFNFSINKNSRKTKEKKDNFFIFEVQTAFERIKMTRKKYINCIKIM